MSKIYATRYHDFSAGHRVVGHESKCRWLHGHNYRVTFTVEMDDGSLDSVGRVMDFSVIKTLLCEWLEENWDHKFLMYKDDPLLPSLADIVGHEGGDAYGSLCVVPFNPTAENMGLYLLEQVGPSLLADHGVKLTRVIVEETRKCSAEVTNQ